MKFYRIFLLLIGFSLITGFDFADESQAPQDCRFIDADFMREKISKYMTSTEQIFGWYLCNGEYGYLNDVQLAELGAKDTQTSFVREYVNQNVHDRKEIKVQKLNFFHGAQAYQSEVFQTTNPKPMKVDFYFLTTKGKKYVIVYKDNLDRYKKSGPLSRKLIAEIITKLKQ